MRIVRLEPEPFHTMPYSLGPGPRSLRALLPFHRAIVEGMPETLDTIIATADLQGIVRPQPNGPPTLLGEALVSELEALHGRGELAAKDRTAALLAGDFHANAHEADVRSVWLAISHACRWVAGVAGNHDAFGASGMTSNKVASALGQGGLHFLDADIVKLDGMLIGGVSGIVSTKVGSWNRNPSNFASALTQLANGGVDVLLCHDGPNVSGTNLPGWPFIREILEESPPSLIIRGHDFWQTPLASLANGAQVLNVEGRVVFLGRDA